MESKRGRNAAQVAANLGMSALATQDGLWGIVGMHPVPEVLTLVAIAALAEAAADTVSSEIGQVLGGTPRLITTLKVVPPGTDGGMTLAGTAAGILSAAIVAGLGITLLGGNTRAILAFSLAGTAAATFGLIFDSLLGATLERHGKLNNDAVNFLSTLASAACALPIGWLFLRYFLKV